MIAKLRAPFKLSENVCPMLTKSTVFTALFISSASDEPAPIQSKLVIAVWKKSKIVLMPFPNDCPTKAQSVVCIKPFKASVIPVATFFTVSRIVSQSRPLKAPLIPFPTASPKLFQ